MNLGLGLVNGLWVVSDWDLYENVESQRLMMMAFLSSRPMKKAMALSPRLLAPQISRSLLFSLLYSVRSLQAAS